MMKMPSGRDVCICSHVHPYYAVAFELKQLVGKVGTPERWKVFGEGFEVKKNNNAEVEDLPWPTTSGSVCRVSQL